MMQKEFKRALQRASIDTGRFMSAGLRKEARASGWPPHIANSLRMHYDRKGFDVRVHESHEATAMDYEYGNTTMQPTAAVRRYLNRAQPSEHYFIDQAFKHLGV